MAKSITTNIGSPNGIFTLLNSAYDMDYAVISGSNPCAEEPKSVQNSVMVASEYWSIYFLYVGMFDIDSIVFIGKHRREPTVIHYHETMVIHPYPSLVVITQFSSWVIFIHGCICILTGLSG